MNVIQDARLHIVQVSVDGDGLVDQGVVADARHVLLDALGLVRDGEPVDELAVRGAPLLAPVGEGLCVFVRVCAGRRA